MAVQGLVEFWPCKNVNKLISGCLLGTTFSGSYNTYLHNFVGLDMNSLPIFSESISKNYYQMDGYIIDYVS